MIIYKQPRDQVWAGLEKHRTTEPGRTGETSNYRFISLLTFSFLLYLDKQTFLGLFSSGNIYIFYHGNSLL